MPRRLDWADHPATDLGVDPARTIALLPVAAIEQHGPHLPLGTDLMIAEGMLDVLRARCPEDLDLRILPVQAVGKSNEHLYAPGTLTLTAETALRAWTEIGLSVARAGVRKLVLISSHGGNVDLTSIVARELRVQAGMLAVKATWFGFGLPEALENAWESRHGLHGGEIETSLMLRFRPDLVRMQHAARFASTAETAPIPPVGPVALGWIAADLNPAGVVGDATVATAEKGRQVAEHQTAALIALLRALEGLDPTALPPTGHAP